MHIVGNIHEEIGHIRGHGIQHPGEKEQQCDKQDSCVMAWSALIAKPMNKLSPRIGDDTNNVVSNACLASSVTISGVT
jgi:hypothetical protein